MGIATGTPTGLVVPVIRNVDELSFSEIEKQIAEKGLRARDGNLSMADMQDGTFTISNGGVYGSLMSSPILNPPQSAVLGMHNIVERPVAIDGKVDNYFGYLLRDETIKGDPNAELTVEPVGNGPAAVVEEDNSIYNTAGIEVKPDFPGGMAKFYKYVGNNYRTPEEEGLAGKVYVTFVVEKDGSLTDIKVVRDIGYGTGKEAIRVLKSCPKWNPGEQNGKKVRVLYSLPITIQSAE